MSISDLRFINELATGSTQLGILRLILIVSYRFHTVVLVQRARAFGQMVLFMSTICITYRRRWLFRRVTVLLDHFGEVQAANFACLEAAYVCRLVWFVSH